MPDVTFSTLAAAEFVSLFLETLAFGIFAVLYGVGVWLLMYRNGARWNRVLFATSTAMLILALAHLALEILRGYEGFIGHNGTRMNNFYADTRSAPYIAKLVIYVTQTLLGDGFMAYRIFVIWNRSWLITSTPILLFIGAASTGYVACYDVTSRTTFDSKGQSTGTSYWFIAFLVISTTHNVLTGSLVVVRITQWKRRVRRLSIAPIVTGHNALEAFIQSAAIYSVVLVLLLMTYTLGANPEIFGMDFLTPVIGITFTLIIIRLGLEEQTAKMSRMAAPAGRASVLLQTPDDGQTSLPIQKPQPTRGNPFMRCAGRSPGPASLDIEPGKNLLQAVEEALAHYMTRTWSDTDTIRTVDHRTC